MDGSVVENPAQHRFEVPVGECAGGRVLPTGGDRVVLTHTEVPQELAGQGIGSNLAVGTFSLIRKSSRKAVAKCPFMSRWASRHPSVADKSVPR